MASKRNNERLWVVDVIRIGGNQRRANAKKSRKPLRIGHQPRLDLMNGYTKAHQRSALGQPVRNQIGCALFFVVQINDYEPG